MKFKNTYYTEKFNDSYERIFSYENRLNGVDDDFFNVFLNIFLEKSEKIPRAFNNSGFRQQKK